MFKIALSFFLRYFEHNWNKKKNNASAKKFCSKLWNERLLFVCTFLVVFFLCVFFKIESKFEFTVIAQAKHTSPSISVSSLRAVRCSSLKSISMEFEWEKKLSPKKKTENKITQHISASQWWLALFRWTGVPTWMSIVLFAKQIFSCVWLRRTQP